MLIYRILVYQERRRRRRLNPDALLDDNLTPTTTSIFTNIVSDVLFNDNGTDMNSFLDPVPIVPTLQQIERATTHTLFGDIINPANTRCSFTLESFQENSPVTQIIYCGHIFNPTSLSRWWEESVRCPLCRYDIRNYNGTNTMNNRYSLGYIEILVMEEIIM